jgi:hypothetical protein
MEPSFTMSNVPSQAMDLPKKPSVSCALAHYLFQLPSQGSLTPAVHKLQEVWKHLFGFVLDVASPPSKGVVTQFMLITRAVLYFHLPDTTYMPTTIIAAKHKSVSMDPAFMKTISTFVQKHFPLPVMHQLSKDFKRQIGGSPMYAELFRNHQLRKTTMDTGTNKTKDTKSIFATWVRVANMAGDTNTLFKPSTLKLLSPSLRDGFVKHGLKKGKTLPNASSSSSSSSSANYGAKARPTKRKAMSTTGPVPKARPKVHQYPAAPSGGWMGLMTGTALCNFISHITPISGKDFQLHIAQIEENRHVMLMKIQVPKNFMLQATAIMTMFQSSLDAIPQLIINAKDLAVISKKFIKTAVCLVFNPSNPEYMNDGEPEPTLTLSSVGDTSSVSFTLVVGVVLPTYTKPKRQHNFRALCTISLSVQLLKPLTMLEKATEIHVLCQVDNVKKRHYIHLNATQASKSKLTASQLFSAELDKNRETSTHVSEFDRVSLFSMDKSDMFVGKITPSTTPQTTVRRAYADAKASNSLQTIFSQKFKIGLLKAITKDIPDKQKICLVMVRERFLLMTIHEYRGSIQVAQLPVLT